MESRYLLYFNKLAALVIAVCTFTTAASASELTRVIALALERDHWLRMSIAEERAVRAEAVAAGELADPRLTASLANLPVDSFDFSQEPMTQVVVGLSQSFPGGDTRRLRRESLARLGDVSPVERELRKAQLRRDITLLWLETALAEETIRLIEADRVLFEQLEDVTRASYGTGTARVNQQDLVRAQLELARLDERLLSLGNTRQRKIDQLGEWVPAESLADVTSFNIEPQTPGTGAIDLKQHPEIRVLDQQIVAARSRLALADAAGRPGWTLSTGYGFRDADRTGRDLSDILSVGFSMALPVARKNRQDKSIEAAAERVAALESKRLLQLQALESRLADQMGTLAWLDQQRELYDQTLLQQMQVLAGASLNAYTSDQGDFADVMRAHLAQLNARVEAKRIAIERQKVITRINYLRGVPS